MGKKALCLRCDNVFVPNEPSALAPAADSHAVDSFESDDDASVGTDEFAPEWRRVRFGLNVVFAAWCSLYVLVALTCTLAIYGPIVGERAMSYVGIGFLGVAGILALAIIVGKTECRAAPGPNARSFANFSAVCTLFVFLVIVAWLAFLFVSNFFDAGRPRGRPGWAPPEPRGFSGTTIANVVVLALVLLLMLGSFCSWMLFHSDVAKTLGDYPLARRFESCLWSMLGIAFAAIVVQWIAYGVDRRFAAQFAPAVNVAYLFALTLWYSLLNRRLALLVAARVSSGRATDEK